MRRPVIFLHALAWAALWGFWVVASRHNHPSLRLNAIASGLLVGTHIGLPRGVADGAESGMSGSSRLMCNRTTGVTDE
jgi:hypothetical protein